MYFFHIRIFFDVQILFNVLHLNRPHAYDITEGRPRALGVKRGTVTCAIVAKHEASGPTPACHTAGLHTNFFSYLPFGQVKSSLSDLYLPERKIYLPKHNNT